MRTDLICDAITMAAGNVELQPGAVFHSDRGSQYTSVQFAAHAKELRTDRIDGTHRGVLG